MPADSSFNDREFAGSVPSEAIDCHGRAALLLVESLLHTLIARSVISAGDAVEIVGIAAEVAEETAAEPREQSFTTTSSLELLRAIRASLLLELARR